MQAKDGSEGADYQLFLTELRELLGLEKPHPASEDTAEDAYVFERNPTPETHWTSAGYANANPTYGDLR